MSLLKENKICAILEQYLSYLTVIKGRSPLSGTSREIESDFLFSTMSMMAKQEIRQQFKTEEFDIIVIDEAHRTGAKSYQDIMEYFQPTLWLGMTASPERTDDFDVFKAYDHNIAYEIRLQQTMEENP